MNFYKFLEDAGALDSKGNCKNNPFRVKCRLTDDEFYISGNRPGLNERWLMPYQKGGAKFGMCPDHSFVVPTVCNWRRFNIVSLGKNKQGDFQFDHLADDILMLYRMKEIVMSRKAEGEELLCLFHPYPHNSVNYLHMHIITVMPEHKSRADLTYHALVNEMVTVDDVISKLETEQDKLKK